MPEFNLNPTQAREAWVKALRSGRYDQTDGKLRDNDGYCCLGVACDVFSRLEPDFGTKWEPYEGQPGVQAFHVEGDAMLTELPYIVQKWLDITNVGDLKTGVDTPSEGFYETLTEINDEGEADFNFIANIIENEGDQLKPAPEPDLEEIYGDFDP